MRYPPHRALFLFPFSFLLFPSLAAFAGDAEHASSDGGEWLTLQCGDFEEVCREQGELRPAKVTTITFTRWGKLAWLAPEGSRVKKGEKVAAVDTEDLLKDLQRCQDDLADAERNLAEQEQSWELDRKRLEVELRASKEKLELAQLKEKELRDHPTAIEKEEAGNLMKGAAARTAAAQAERAALSPLIEKGFAQRADLEARELAVKVAAAEEERARVVGARKLAGATETERAKAVQNRTMAELEHQMSQAEYERVMADFNDKVGGAKRRVADLQRRLADQKRWLEESVRTAPHDGIVVHREAGWHDRKKLEVGDQVGPWRSPVDLPNLDVMHVRTQVPESVVGQLAARRATPAGWRPEAGGRRLGLAAPVFPPAYSLQPDTYANGLSVPAPPAAGSPARVRLQVLPSKAYPAEVVWIDPWARDRNANLSEADGRSQGPAGVQVFNVEVEILERDPERLKEGFRAFVEFPLRTLPGVLVVPRRAVRLQAGKAFVQVGSDGAPQPREVVLGPESNGKAVIQAGLREGERIWVPPGGAVAPQSRRTGEQ